MEEHCSLASCLGLLHMLSYIPQDHLSMDGTSYSSLDLPTSIINQENAPIHVHKSDKGNFSIEAPFPQVTLVYMKLTKATTSTKGC